MSVRVGTANLSRTATVPAVDALSGKLFARLRVDNTFAGIITIGESFGGFFQIGPWDQGDNCVAYDDDTAVTEAMFTMTVDTWYTFVWTKSGATSFRVWWGPADGSTALSGPVELTTVFNDPIERISFSLNRYGVTFDGGIIGVSIWTDVLTDQEVADERVQIDPVRTADLWAYWPMVDADTAVADTSGNSRDLTASGTLVTEEDPPDIDRVAGGGSGELAGSAAGVATVTGTLTGDGALAGTAAGSATAMGALTGDGALAGSAAGVGTASGVLVGDGALAGAAAGAGTATGELVGDGALAGAAAGTATVTGTLTGSGDGALSGTAAGVATVSGTLVGDGALAGSAAGAATVAGELEGSGALAGSAAGVATTMGTLTGDAPGAISGTAAGVATATGTLVGDGALAGSAAGTSTVSGSLGGGAVPVRCRARRTALGLGLF